VITLRSSYCIKGNYFTKASKLIFDVFTDLDLWKDICRQLGLTGVQFWEKADSF
jgi:hypothetical protein